MCAHFDNLGLYHRVKPSVKVFGMAFAAWLEVLVFVLEKRAFSP
jgi:hypothetical protein